MNVCVLGAGLVGRAIAIDLAGDPRLNVTAFDLSETALADLNRSAPVETKQVDLSESSRIHESVREADLVVCAVPGFMGFRTLEAIVDAGKNVVDISFFPEDPLLLHDRAVEKNITAVVDCGVAPGLCNVIAGFEAAAFDRTDSYRCYVGGLPERPERPFEYRAVFSPADVIEEYTRPARMRIDGRIVTRPALSDIELKQFPEIGMLEAFNTDGLRTLLQTLDIPNMTEKTLRYPGHADLMRVFRDSGFFDTEELEIDGHSVRPLDVTSTLLFDAWRMRPGERDITVMRVELEGERSGTLQRRTYELLDRRDEQSGIHSMARTTGYTATAVAHLLVDGTFRVPGVHPPEVIGARDGLLLRVLDDLRERGISVHARTENVSEDTAG
jgi:saccharopine dehydrogenase-like NADP-dependent oxidoreductase